MLLRIDRLRLDGGTQPRADIDRNTVRDYADALSGEATFPPVTVFHDGEAYWLADGFHRVHAHKMLDWLEVDADVRQGTRRDAVLYSVGANAVHGLRRTNADKHRAVETLLNDPEWAAWSDREISRRAGVGHPFVSSLRPMSLESDSSERTYTTKHGTQATMQTAAIGKRPAPQTAPGTYTFPPFDPETGEVLPVERSEPTYSVEFLEAAYRPMTPATYEPPLLSTVEAEAQLRQIQGLLNKLLTFKLTVTHELFHYDTMGATRLLCDLTLEMLGDWVAPPASNIKTIDAWTVDA